MKQKNVFIILAMLILLSSVITAKPYVSLSGQFHVQIPDNWEKIDYKIVDQFLFENNVGQGGFYYDAAFAPKTNKPFYNGNYVIIAYERVGELSEQQIDSVLATLSSSFGTEIKYFPAGNYLTDLASNAPNYDKENKLVTILNDVTQKAEAFKKNLLLYKFYNKGVAKFYFYSPDSLFENSKIVFNDIALSFSDENIEEALPKETVTVADIDTDSDDDNNSSMIAIYAALAVVLFTVIRRRRKKQKQTEG